MGKNRSASGLVNVIQYDDNGNISFVSGSTTLMSVSSSGAITTTGVISGSSVQSASLAQNSNLLQGTGSVGFTTTASFTATSGSASSRLTQIEAVYATTGSNSFRATQSITGSLTVTGQIIAQTINVQQVTSSIIYSSGSNVFGCDLNSRQTFTGSVLMTGSLIVNTTGPELQVNNNGVTIGNLSTDNHNVTGSLRINTNGLFVSSSGFVGLNKAVPQRQYTQVANANGIVFTIQNAASSNEGFIAGFDTPGSTYVQLSNSANSPGVYLNSSGSSYFTGGNVGIGTTLPGSALEIRSGTGNTILGLVPNTNTDYALIKYTTANGTSYIGTDNSAGAVFGQGGYSMNMFHVGTGPIVLYTGGTARMFVSASGNVGIGTTSPTTKFFVLGAGSYNTTTSEILTSDATIFSSEMSNDAYNSILQLVSVRQSLSTGASSNGFLGFSTIDDSNGEGIRDAGRIAIVNETAAARNSPTALGFWTNPGGTKTTAATEKMRISSAGAVTTPLQPFVIGGLDGNQSISLNTFTTLNFSTSVGMFYYANVGNCWNNTTRAFTAPVTGTYLVNVSLLTDSVGQVALFVNGNRKHSIPSGPFTGTITWGGSAIIPLSSGEVLTLQGYGIAGTVTQNTFHTFFAIYLLG